MQPTCDECGQRVNKATVDAFREFKDGRLEAIEDDGRAHLEPCGHFSTYTMIPETPTYPT